MVSSKGCAFAKILLIVSTTTLTLLLPCKADESTGALKSGMTAFNEGKYSDAAGHFGLALTTEFNNSVLHYYLGNCFVHMNQRDAAVREFRIAYALDPEKDVGKYAKQALVGLNADSSTPTVGKGTQPVAKDNKGKIGTSGLSSGPPASSTGSGSQLIPKSTIEIGPGGKLIEHPPKPPAPPVIPGQPVAAQPPPPNLSPYPRYDPNRRYYRNDDTARAALELQRAAENLHELLSTQAKPGEHHIVPTGTNLYIRNYQTEGKSKQPGTK